MKLPQAMPTHLLRHNKRLAHHAAFLYYRGMEDEYHQIKGPAGYRVNRHGTIINPLGSVLRPFETKNGYMKINILKHGYYVHRLVAEAFLPNPDGKPQVNHKDGNKTNNESGNLEWVTNSENMLDAFRKREYSRLNKKPVIEKTSGLRFGTIAEASRYFGVNPSTISKSIHEKRSIINGRRFVPISDIAWGD